MKIDQLSKVIDDVLGYTVNSFVCSALPNGTIEKLRIDGKKLTKISEKKLIKKYPEIFGTNGEKFKDSR